MRSIMDGIRGDDLVEEIVKKWSQTDPLLETIAMEECGELIQAISKIVRYGKADAEIKNLSEECADVLICIEALAEKYGLKPYIEVWQRSKVERLDERIKAKSDGKSAGYHKCINCKWYDNFIGVCTCADSEWRADFRDDDNVCERWEDKYGKTD